MWIKQINQKKNIVINNDDKQNFSLFSNSNKHTNTRLTPSLYTLINGTHAMHKLITVLYIFHVKSGAETERIKSNEGKNFDIFFFGKFCACDWLFSVVQLLFVCLFCWILLAIIYIRYVLQPTQKTFCKPIRSFFADVYAVFSVNIIIKLLFDLCLYG